MANLFADLDGYLRPGVEDQYKLLIDDLSSEAVTQELIIGGGISPQYSHAIKSSKCPGSFGSAKTRIICKAGSGAQRFDYYQNVGGIAFIQ